MRRLSKNAFSFSVTKLDMWNASLETATFSEEIKADAPGGRIFVDCSSLAKIDSSGFGAMIHMSKNIAGDREVVFSGLNDEIMRTIRMIGIDQAVVFSAQTPPDALK